MWIYGVLRRVSENESAKFITEEWLFCIHFCVIKSALGWEWQLRCQEGMNGNVWIPRYRSKINWEIDKILANNLFILKLCWFSQLNCQKCRPHAKCLLLMRKFNPIKELHGRWVDSSTEMLHATTFVGADMKKLRLVCVYFFSYTELICSEQISHSDSGMPLSSLEVEKPAKSL